MNYFYSLIASMFGFVGITAMLPMCFAEDDKGGAAKDGSADGDDNADAKEDDKAAAKKDAGDDKQGKSLTQAEYKALNAANERKFKEQLEARDKQHQAKISQLEARLTELTSKKQDAGDDDKKPKKTAEYFELKEKHEATQQKLTELAKENEQLRQQERDFRFETIVKGALSKFNIKPGKLDMAFRMISPDLKFDESGRKVFTTVETESGDVDLDAEQYVKNYVSTKILPEFFNSNAKAGSVASGGGGGSSSYDFTKKEMMDPDFYAKHRDEIMAAYKAGRVDLSD